MESLRIVAKVQDAMKNAKCARKLLKWGQGTEYIFKVGEPHQGGVGLVQVQVPAHSHW